MSSRKSRVTKMRGQQLTAEEFFGNNSEPMFETLFGSKRYPDTPFGVAFISIIAGGAVALIFAAFTSTFSPEKKDLNKWGPAGIAILGAVLCIIFIVIGFNNYR